MKYTILEKLTALREKLSARKAGTRLLALLLTLVLLQGDLMLPAYSAGGEGESGETSAQTSPPETTVPTTPEQTEAESKLPVDEDTLVITLDGTETSVLELFAYEKVEVRAEGLEQQADYQWQIQHPETGAWINIYDATEQCISVSAALVKNMLDEDGTAALRCRAHTEEYAYLSDSIRIILRQDSSASATTSSTQLVSLEDPAVPLADGDATPEFVTVTIEYLQYDFQRDNQDKLILVDGQPILETNGKVAFTSYMATLHGGGELKTTVHFPTIVGYDSYWEDEKTPSTQHTFEEDSITQDLTYQVSYKPALVSYTVRYFFQNIYDDLYVEDSSKKITSKGYTGATPPDSELNAEVAGFTPLYYQPDSIAADGSTIFEVFYERNYYLMEFDCNEGYGAETVYVRYGSHISVPAPIRPGYVFGENGDGNGWDLVKTEQVATAENPLPTLGDGVGDTLPATMPPYNSGYKAIWDTTQTKYTVVYWRENADDNEYSYWGSVQYDAESGTLISGTDHSSAPTTLDDYAYFTYNAPMTITEESKREDLVNGKVLVDGDESTVVNVYYYRNTYTITFVASGLCVLDEHNHDNGDCVYRLLCNQGDHVHSSECVKTLICTTPEHEVHTNDCLTCFIPEHAHSTTCSVCDKEGHVHDAGCCNLEEHVHSTDCYSLSNGTWGAAYDGTPTGTTAANGIVRTGNNNNNYRYYYKIGNTWYQITGLSNQTGSANYYANVTVEVCTKNVHSHGDGNCDYSSCALHVHTAECYKCGKTTHTHSVGCCTVEEHVHSTDCYSLSNGTWGAAYDGTPTGTTAANGIVRTGNNNNNYRYYYKIGNTWYQITGLSNQTGSANYYANVTVEVCTKNVHSHGDGNCVYCTEEEHTHSNACMDCGLVAHTHTDSCYKDVIHTHTETCYSYSCGASAHTHTSGCYGDCTLIEHTHTNSCNSSSSSSTVKTVTRKYGANISDIWPVTDDNGVTYDDGQRWDPSGSSVYTQVLVFLKIMPNHNLTLTVDVSNKDTYTMYYYTEVVAGDEYDVTYNGKNFKLAFDPVQARYGYVTKAEDFFDIAGYTQWASNPSFSGNSITINGGGNVYFYYTRNTYELNFHNYNAVLSDKTQSLQFEQSLAAYEISKDELEKSYYPSTLEPGAYEFGGWYTSPGCYDGTEVNWATIKMPDEPLTLYAKWTPIMRNVIFYSAYSDIQEDKDDTSDKIYHFMKADNIPHGTELGSAYYSTPEWPQDLDTALNGGSEAELYDFVGWFYMDENGKKRFAPDSMEITRDLVLFAEWQTSIDTTYEVQYVLAEDVSAENVPSNTAYSKGTVIADTISAHSTVGKTKTFNAKGGTELYSDFQAKFFPIVNSHSILMEQNGDENKFTFEYRYDDTVYYKVRYVDYSTRTELRDSKVMASEKAIVTEKFLPIEGYLPQNYYITKALAYDGNATSPIEENIITFYYTKDTEHGLYSVEYYLENPDSTDDTKPENYYQYESIVGSDDINLKYTAQIRTYEGYTYVPSLNTVITYKENGDVDKTLVGTDAGDPPYGTVKYTGLTIKIYYKRNSYPYFIEYREYGSDALLKTVEDGSAKFDTDKTHVAETSFELDGLTYEYYIDNADEAARTKTMTIRVPVEDDSDTYEDETFANKLTFYYKKHEVTVHYVAVCKTPDATGFGGLSFYNERAATASGLNGSNATAGSGFTFTGWFSDAKCTVPVDASWRYIPGTADTPDEQNNNGTKLIPGSLNTAVDDVYYYALFEPVLTSMTLTKVIDITSYDDTFLFMIEGQGKHTYLKMTVAVPANSTVTITEIPIDEYKITELTAWSWEYSKPKFITANAVKEDSTTVDLPNAAITFTIVEQDTHQTKNNIQFTNQYVKPKWLGGESAVADNNFD